MKLKLAVNPKVPRNQTALLQHLQRLVGVEQYRYWCGGTVSLEKAPRLLAKFTERYPLSRNTRQRAYDRARRRAAMQLIVYPIGCEPCDWVCTRSVRKPVRNPAHEACIAVNAEGCLVPQPIVSEVQWWLVSTEGTGGLGDPTVPDAHVARDAMLADQHVTYGDYVLVYATKNESKPIKSLQTGRTRIVHKKISTWTWMLRRQVILELHAAINACCARLEYGSEPGEGRGGWGLRGLLHAQRKRPLFSGVRNQVLDLHRYAEEAWKARRGVWLKAHPDLAARFGKSAGSLRPMTSVAREFMPKMTRHRIYGSEPLLVSDLLADET